jgi:hypothetical protein
MIKYPHFASSCFSLRGFLPFIIFSLNVVSRATQSEKNRAAQEMSNKPHFFEKLLLPFLFATDIKPSEIKIFRLGAEQQADKGYDCTYGENR